MRGRLSFIFRIIVGGIFLISGLAKISDPIRFILTLREFRLFPEIIIPFTAIYLPWLEFILGLLLITGLLYRTGSLMLACLNFVFMLAILSVIVRGIDVDCGCFGLLADMLKIPDMADMKAVIRNLLFIGMSIYIFRAKRTIFSLENYLKKV
ncbi:MAG: MauE/DoxX family redox-associated membrane protein [Thermodesulfovibrionales bacterium]|nr:MauE/DoxX family redox-associated membrane protein [Thermodesulfovibrionales bacterium]MDP3112713.1 MauE/DoxX family redox-associated membrane protein [Thermodesulfovibrionales bacterium]